MTYDMYVHTYYYGDVKDLPSNLGSWAKSSPELHVIISGTSPSLEDVIQLSSQTRQLLYWQPDRLSRHNSRYSHF